MIRKAKSRTKEIDVQTEAGALRRSDKLRSDSQHAFFISGIGGGAQETCPKWGKPPNPMPCAEPLINDAKEKEIRRP